MLLLPETPGSRRVVPPNPPPTTVEHVRDLLSQDEVWVTRARWPRWLRDGDPSDTVPIASMGADDRLAARAWLAQQRHVLHRTLGGDGARAPAGWMTEQPLFRGLGG